MKVTATIAAVALAFAASTRAATCTPGLDYCSNVLLDVDPSNRNAISQTLQSSGGGDYANDQFSWHSLIFHCNIDHSLTWRRCGDLELCANQGSGKNDVCVYAPIF
ncbi:uncharacterized protein AKAW2_40030S [Aspergillus luchuensis]|uniref:Uncharacterized protein n=1 Tax=Aspergillus kawachii TaxID=1069201 RepID=A0A7R7W8J0_ASPKA|nr:uncharacterized protein AKAW2_40030S [Aspergillus luchuensis]BCR98347.1 hypothetical protein AKAW2_40030S [Aspergillus luchuensis]BCS10691.1 hypothetical protein ALUC_40031S [Aspergillus luchuensis]